jgi:hypothetical protein
MEITVFLLTMSLLWIVCLLRLFMFCVHIFAVTIPEYTGFIRNVITPVAVYKACSAAFGQSDRDLPEYCLF